MDTKLQIETSSSYIRQCERSEFTLVTPYDSALQLAGGQKSSREQGGRNLTEQGAEI